MMSHKRFKNSLLSVAIGTASLATQMPANAQDFALEEIVVTAQKREQNVQDVPVAISVMNADSIEKLDIKNFDDVARVSPALTIQSADQPSDNSIRMRGVGTAVYSISAEPSVSVVVDEVPLMVSAQAFNNLMDIERIEVLRGPQGTLFGKNASAGVVSITTQAPSQEFSAKTGVRFTDDDEKKVDLSVSGPLTDTLSYRVSGFYTDREGYIENLEDGSDFNGEESHGVRAKLLWEPSDKLDMTLILDTSERKASSVSTWFAHPDPGAGITAGEDNRKVRYDTPNEFKSDQTMAIFKLNYDLGGHVLTSVTSYQNYKLDALTDGDYSPNPVPQNPFLNPGGFPAGTPSFEMITAQDSDSFTQELRLTSTWSDKFEYMVGAYYSDVEHYRSLDRYAIRFILDHWEAAPTNESMALFGQGSLSLAENTYLDLGIRFNREEISTEYTDFIPNRNDLSAAPVTFGGKDSESAVTGKIALRHFLQNDAMVYASVSTGYKGLAYDISSGFTPEAAADPVGSEDSINYEIGIKGKTADRRLSYEVVAFLTDFEDYQAQGSVVTETSVDFSLNNVGELRTQGVEVDLSYQATESLRLDFSGAWVDATIEDWVGAECYFGQTAAQGCNVPTSDPSVFLQDLSGKDLNNSPDFKFNAGAYWEQVSSSMPFNWFAQANYQWQDEVNFDLYGAPNDAEDAYGIANFGVGIVEPSGRYQVTLFVNNAFDERYSTGYQDLSDRQDDGNAYITKQWTRESRRYAGIKASYAF